MNRLLTGDDGGTDTRPALCRVRVHIEQHQPRQVVFDMDTCSKPATYRICRAPQLLQRAGCEPAFIEPPALIHPQTLWWIPIEAGATGKAAEETGRR